MAALEFAINVTGNMAGALESVNAGLGKTEKGTKQAAHTLSVFESELGKASGSLGGFGFNLQAFARGGSIFTFDLAEGARIAFEMFRKLGEAVVDIGKDIIKTAGSAEDLNLALELNVGVEGAEKFKSLAESFQRTTRFSAAQMKEAWLPLLDIGIKEPKMIDDLSTAAADIAARTHGGISKVQEVLGAFRTMVLRDQINRGTFTTLGIDQKGFYGALAARRGVSAEVAEKMAKSHQISSDELVQTALGQIAGRQGGALGVGTLAAADTLGGTLERLGNLKENLFEKLAGGPGMKAVQSLLDNFVEVMGGPVGAKLIEKLDTAFKTVFGDFSGPDGTEKMEAALDKLGTQIGNFIVDAGKLMHELGGIPGVIDKIITGAEILGTVLGGAILIGGITALAGALPALATGAGMLVGVLGAITSPMLAVGAAALSVGIAIRQIVETVKELGGLGRVWDDLKFAIAGKSANAYGVNENSPEWKKAESMPKFASGGIVNGPTIALVGEAGPEAIVPLSGARQSILDTAMGGDASGPGGFGSTSVVFAPVYNVSGGNVSDDAAGPLAQAVRVEFVKALEEAGLAFGAG